MNRNRLFDGAAAVLVGALCAAPVAAAAAPAAPTATFGDAKVELRGRVHLDAAYHDEDDVSLDDGFLNRRARIGAIGTLDDWSLLLEYDFAENGTAAQDLILGRKVGGGTVNVGQFKVPMGLSELTSSNHIMFLERPTANNLMVGEVRRLGVGYDYFGSNYTVQTMVFGRAIGAKEAGDMPLGIAGRFAYSPEVGGSRLHLGVSAAYEDRRGYTTLRFRDRPEARIDGSRLIDTGDIDGVSSTTKLGLELAYLAGPFSAEAEYFNVDVDTDTDADPSFGGYHVQASYVLTGESRGYRNGIFRGVSPESRAGAWEVAARFSSADLVDAGIQGGEQDTITLGLNYYANNNVRFMANYIMVDVSDSTARVLGGNLLPVIVGDESPNIFAVRAQVHF
jgi:phosphate-selective porin OprO and OprP